MGLINTVRRGCIFAVLCMGLCFAALGVAAEVKPIAVEVVDDSGVVSSVASLPDRVLPQAPDAPDWARQEMHNPHFAEMVEDLLIPVLALLLIFGGPVLMVIVIAVLRYRARGRRERAQSENIARLLDAGRDVPLELLQGADVSVKKAEDNLRKGLTNVGVGVGLTIFLIIFLGLGIGSVGFIVIGLGVSQLLVWKLVDSKRMRVDSGSDVPRF
jgi:hypothetical protein